MGWFGVLWLACCLSALIISGMLPLRARTANLASPGIAGLVVVNAVVLLFLLAGTLLFAAITLRVVSIILFAGWIFLFVPALLNALPQRWTDSRGGLTVLLCIQVLALVILCRFTQLATPLPTA